MNLTDPRWGAQRRTTHDLMLRNDSFTGGRTRQMWRKEWTKKMTHELMLTDSLCYRNINYTKMGKHRQQREPSVRHPGGEKSKTSRRRASHEPPAAAIFVPLVEVWSHNPKARAEWLLLARVMRGQVQRAVAVLGVKLLDTVVNLLVDAGLQHLSFQASTGRRLRTCGMLEKLWPGNDLASHDGLLCRSLHGHPQGVGG